MGSHGSGWRCFRQLVLETCALRLMMMVCGVAAPPAGEERAAAFARYREEQGAALEDFATFGALADHFAAEGRGRDWRAWPEAFRSPPPWGRPRPSRDRSGTAAEGRECGRKALLPRFSTSSRTPIEGQSPCVRYNKGEARKR